MQFMRSFWQIDQLFEFAGNVDMASRDFLLERIWQRQYANHAEAKADIVGFYNCKRFNSVLGDLSPAACKWKMAEVEPIVVSEIT